MMDIFNCACSLESNGYHQTFSIKPRRITKRDVFTTQIQYRRLMNKQTLLPACVTDCVKDKTHADLLLNLLRGALVT